MTEQEFQELFRNLYGTVGLSEAKSRMAATWVVAARGFVAELFFTESMAALVVSFDVRTRRAAVATAQREKG
jgi:hypothetical protein